MILFHSPTASEHGPSITPGDHHESGASLYPTTQDTGRRLPAATTAPPVNILNHHPLYRNPPRHPGLISPHGQLSYFEDGGGSISRPGSQPTFSTSLDSSGKRASDESTERSNMQTALVMKASAAAFHTHTPVPATSVSMKNPEHAASIHSAAAAGREKKDMRPDEEETTTSTITTTTIITTMQSPGESAACMLNQVETWSQDVVWPRCHSCYIYDFCRYR